MQQVGQTADGAHSHSAACGLHSCRIWILCSRRLQAVRYRGYAVWQFFVQQKLNSDLTQLDHLRAAGSRGAHLSASWLALLGHSSTERASDSSTPTRMPPTLVAVGKINSASTGVP